MATTKSIVSNGNGKYTITDSDGQTRVVNQAQANAESAKSKVKITQNTLPSITGYIPTTGGNYPTGDTSDEKTVLIAGKPTLVADAVAQAYSAANLGKIRAILIKYNQLTKTEARDPNNLLNKWAQIVYGAANDPNPKNKDPFVYAAELQKQGFGSTPASTGYTGPMVYPKLTNAEDAKAKIVSNFKTLLDREPTDAEVKAATAALNADENDKKNYTTQTPIKNSAGQIVGYKSSGGTNPDQFLTDYINKNFASEVSTVKTVAPDLAKREAEKKIYDDLIAAAAGDPAKIKKANETTAYGRGLQELKAAIKAKAESSNATNTDEEIATLAKSLYDKGILLNSSEGMAQLDATLKTETGLVKDQQADLLKIAADKKIYEKAVAAAGNDPDKIQKAMDSTAYGRGLKELLAALKTKAADVGATNTLEELTTLAKSLYDKGIPLNSNEGFAAVDAVLKNKNGLVKGQSADLVKIAANKKIYDDLIAAAAGDSAAIEKAKQTTIYGRGIKALEESLKSLAQTEGALNTPEEIAALAEDLYNNGIDPNSSQGKKQINSTFKYGIDSTSGGFKGRAATTIADLQKTAVANGLDLNKNFANQLSGWISAINSGEQIENIKQKIRDVAKLGQPDSVKKLIDNGTDLDTIYSPYRNTMASVLEIQDPNSISLTDPTLRMAITPNGELNLYDYQKALRKDNRWQYTQQANSEVADATQRILKDFGFMG